MTMVTSINIKAKAETWDEAAKLFYKQLYKSLESASPNSLLVVKTPPCHAQIQQDGVDVFALDFKFDLIESSYE